MPAIGIDEELMSKAANEAKSKDASLEGLTMTTTREYSFAPSLGDRFSTSLLRRLEPMQQSTRFSSPRQEVLHGSILAHRQVAPAYGRPETNSRN
jgi:hypothetical protein